jgi:hypothetical protein
LEQERCQESWWKNILYINNYYGNDKLCMFQSWYLAGELIIFLISNGANEKLSSWWSQLLVDLESAFSMFQLSNILFSVRGFDFETQGALHSLSGSWSSDKFKTETLRLEGILETGTFDVDSMALETWMNFRQWWIDSFKITFFPADTQLFVLAPLFIYPLWKSKKLGLHLLSIAAALSVIVPFYITYTQKLDPTFIIWPRLRAADNIIDQYLTIIPIYTAKFLIYRRTITSSIHTERRTCDRQLTSSAFSPDFWLFTYTRSSEFIYLRLKFVMSTCQVVLVSLPINYHWPRPTLCLPPPDWPFQVAREPFCGYQQHWSESTRCFR